MKAIIDLAKKPQSGIVAFVEGKLLRMFIDLKNAERHEIDEEGHDTVITADDQFECRSIDTEQLSYGGIVDAIITENYPLSSQYAILANKQLADDPESKITEEKRAEYIADYNTFQTYRQYAKDTAHAVCEMLDL